MRKYCGTPRETIPFTVMDFFVDIYAKLFFKRRARNINVTSPERILIASLGHLGDALTVTYLFPLIKKKYPDVKIDLLAPTWCEAVNKYNPYIDRTIYINHYQTNRKKISRWEKIKEHYRTFREALPLLQQYSYDYYIDIRYSDAVAHFVLPYIKVGKAFGFARRGLGGLLDKEFDVPTEEFHHFDMYFMLLHEIGIEGKLTDVEPYFNISSGATFEKIKTKITLPRGAYLMVFPESGGEHKQLSPAFWASVLTEILEKTGYYILLCGQTGLSKKIWDLIDIPTANRVIDSSGKINIHEIALLSQKASFALTLDSFPEHLCCIFSKTVSVYKGTGYPFFPLANFPVYLIHNHKPSVGLPFDRDNVELVYRENLETPEIKELILNRVSPVTVDE
ncbi:glycosyltransferase family 9 protein [Emticicia agri]|uniref:Lipopolysaccharide heptosyltransferase family protein n=1 Tax=Emticicia agri TaxID=2492393 RepID=A0A4Q5LZD2_9BACT|nr:glycosyltransferase family 9 protein [Emticicia agri]RYU94917.1 lipopolysaccharide heptosyltransferase family protein [Emticicia agri]